MSLALVLTSPTEGGFCLYYYLFIRFVRAIFFSYSVSAYSLYLLIKNASGNNVWQTAHEAQRSMNRRFTIYINRSLSPCLKEFSTCKGHCNFSSFNFYSEFYVGICNRLKGILCSSTTFSKGFHKVESLSSVWKWLYDLLINIFNKNNGILVIAFSILGIFWSTKSSLNYWRLNKKQWFNMINQLYFKETFIMSVTFFKKVMNMWF